MDIHVMPLGAGQEVGRSCIMLNVGAVSVMLDCGIHLGLRGNARLPAFSQLGDAERIQREVHAVVITHYHLDHIGALPYLTQELGYRGPVVMTAATRALAPLILEDYHQICTGRGDVLYTKEQISACLDRVTEAPLDMPIRLPHGVTLTAHYAGHVIGAAMFHIRCGAASVLYTGDYNMTSDRHIGAARLPPIAAPDLLITEATYATTLRESRRGRERRFLEALHAAVRSGGKVLIPVFALGNAQELSVLVDGYWRRQGLQVPLYMTTGMARKAAELFAMLTDWGSQALRKEAASSRCSPFASPRFQSWHPSLTHAEGPCVLFATPGMLHGGISLRVFKVWAGDPKNLVILPGYCTAGTIGHMLRKGWKKGEQKALDIEGERIAVRCKVDYMSFSAHTDLKGIVDVIRHTAPAAVVMVHGEPDKMRFLQSQVEGRMGVPAYMPANCVLLSLPVPSLLPVRVTAAVVEAAAVENGSRAMRSAVAALAESGERGRDAVQDFLRELQPDASSCVQEPSSESAALVDAAMCRLLGSVPSIADSTLRSSGTVVLSEDADAQRDVCLMTGEQALQAGATLGDPQRVTTDTGFQDREEGALKVERYVRHVARAVAEWISASGHGSLEVVGNGSIIRVGTTRARLVVADEEGTSVLGSSSSGHNNIKHTGHDDCPSEHKDTSLEAAFTSKLSSQTRQWAWQVLWSGTAQDVGEASMLSEALMANAVPANAQPQQLQ